MATPPLHQICYSSILYVYTFILEADGASAMLKKEPVVCVLSVELGASSPALFWGLLLSKFSSQAIPGSLSDSTDRGLNAGIQGELCFPGTACPFQLVSD